MKNKENHYKKSWLQFQKVESQNGQKQGKGKIFGVEGLILKKHHFGAKKTIFLIKIRQESLCLSLREGGGDWFICQGSWFLTRT